MYIYAVKFREKGVKTYCTVLIAAKDAVEVWTKFEEFVEKEFVDVDRRTVAWAGNSIPFMAPNDNRFIVIGANLDELC